MRKLALSRFSESFHDRRPSRSQTNQCPPPTSSAHLPRGFVPMLSHTRILRSARLSGAARLYYRGMQVACRWHAFVAPKRRMVMKFERGIERESSANTPTPLCSDILGRYKRYLTFNVICPICAETRSFPHTIGKIRQRRPSVQAHR